MVDIGNSSSGVIKIHLWLKSAHAANAQQQLLRPPLTHKFDMLKTENEASREKIINAVCTRMLIA